MVGKWCFLLPLGVFVVHVPFVASYFFGGRCQDMKAGPSTRPDLLVTVKKPWISRWSFHILQDRSQKTPWINADSTAQVSLPRFAEEDDTWCCMLLAFLAVTLKVPKFLLESDVRFYCSHMVILFQINLRLECSTGANILSLWGVMPVCLKCGEFPRRLFVA